MTINSTRRGFTLVELLVVVLIIGILGAIMLPQYQKAVLNSHLIQMITLIDTLKKGSELYYLANSRYPTDVRKLDLDLGAKEYKNSTSISPGNMAAFFDENTECVVYSSRIACMSKNFYVLRSLKNSIGTICIGRNAMAEAVCKSNSNGISVAYQDSFKSNGYVINP